MNLSRRRLLFLLIPSVSGCAAFFNPDDHLGYRFDKYLEPLDEGHDYRVSSRERIELFRSFENLFDMQIEQIESDLGRKLSDEEREEISQSFIEAARNIVNTKQIENPKVGHSNSG